MTKAVLPNSPSLTNSLPYKSSPFYPANFSPNLSLLTTYDKALFQETVLKFRPISNYYEDSWGYIIQATRYGGFKWYNKNTGSLILFCRKSSTDNTLVVPNFFAKMPYLKKVLHQILEIEHGNKVIFKNIDPSHKKAFISKGFREYKHSEYWDKFAKFDDQTYPQLVIDLHKLAVHKGRPYRNLRTALRKRPNVIFREYKDIDKDQVLNIFALRDGIKNNTFSKEEGMYYASHAMYPDANIDKFVIVENITNEILGFIAASDISTRNTTLVASIFKPGVKVESIWGMYQAMLVKHQEGFRQINIGGFETEGTYNFLRRSFRPVQQIERTHLLYSLD